LSILNPSAKQMISVMRQNCCWWIWSFKRILSQENTLWRK